jgi:hypothetical protein
MMMAASFVAMYALMYAMVNVADNAVPNVNQAYMAGLMSAPMLILELILMDSMYSNKTANKVLMVVGVINVLVGDPKPGSRARRPVSQVNDSTSCRRHPDVRKSRTERS